MDDGDRLLASLGDGSFASVKCYRLCSGDVVAVKAYSRARVQSSGRVERVLNEKEVLLRLSKAHCYFTCSLLETRKDDANLYFVLEACLGGSLNKHLSVLGSFDVAIARLYIAQLAAGLMYLSRRGVVHRDFKLNNVLLDKYGHVKICDFGSAKILYEAESCEEVLSSGYDKAPKTYTLVGSLQHMSPEMLSKKFGYTTSSDWYSLGVMVFELLFGSLSSGEDRRAETNWQFISIEDVDIDLKRDCIEAIECYSPDSPSMWGLRRLSKGVPKGFADPEDSEYCDALGLISALLAPSPAFRLGPFAPHALRAHPFFSGTVDFDSLAACRDGGSTRSPNRDFDRRLGYLDLVYSDDVEAVREADQELFREF